MFWKNSITNIYLVAYERVTVRAKEIVYTIMNICNQSILFPINQSNALTISIPFYIIPLYMSLFVFKTKTRQLLVNYQKVTKLVNFIVRIHVIIFLINWMIAKFWAVVWLGKWKNGGVYKKRAVVHFLKTKGCGIHCKKT